jgi:hypothetical protein
VRRVLLALTRTKRRLHARDIPAKHGDLRVVIELTDHLLKLERSKARAVLGDLTLELLRVLILKLCKLGALHLLTLLLLLANRNFLDVVGTRNHLGLDRELMARQP